MALSPADSESLFCAVYNVIMGYNRDYINRDEARRMIEMLVRGAARARDNPAELRSARPNGDGPGSD